MLELIIIAVPRRRAAALFVPSSYSRLIFIRDPNSKEFEVTETQQSSYSTWSINTGR